MTKTTYNIYHEKGKVDEFIAYSSQDAAYKHVRKVDAKIGHKFIVGSNLAPPFFSYVVKTVEGRRKAVKVDKIKTDITRGFLMK